MFGLFVQLMPWLAVDNGAFRPDFNFEKHWLKTLHRSLV